MKEEQVLTRQPEEEGSPGHDVVKKQIKLSLAHCGCDLGEKAECGGVKLSESLESSEKFEHVAKA